MAANEKQKRQKDNPQDKTSLSNKEKPKKSFQPPQTPKPFQQFSNQNNFKGAPSPKSFNAFHRRAGK